MTAAYSIGYIAPNEFDLLNKRILMKLKSHSVLPGFGLSMGFTILYLSLIVLIPLSGLIFIVTSMSWEHFCSIVTDARAMASYRLSFGASFAAASINMFFGLIAAWVLVRYEFFGKKFLDALVDIPFALPTSVSGITLATLYSRNGWLGRYFELFGIQVSFTSLGVIIALTFISMPFVIRSLQPAIQELDPSVEEAADCLGASRWQTFLRVTLPAILPSLLTGFALALARALGEYGSVIFIAGNMPLRTEIAPLLIIIKLEQYDRTGAAAIALVMLIASFLLLLLINLFQRWSVSQKATQG